MAPSELGSVLVFIDQTLDCGQYDRRWTIHMMPEEIAGLRQ
ncbi:MAG: hypothetical protein V8Q84_06050 [Bilophila sp.]